MFHTFGVMHWSLVALDSSLANGNDDECFIHLESCTGVWLSKTGPPLLMGMTNDVSYIKSYALEFGWVRLPPCQWE